MNAEYHQKNKNAFGQSPRTRLVTEIKHLQFHSGMTLTQNDLELDVHINTISWSQQKNLVSKLYKSPFYQGDLELSPMTLILKPDLDMAKMYHHTKNQFLCEVIP